MPEEGVSAQGVRGWRLNRALDHAHGFLVRHAVERPGVLTRLVARALKTDPVNVTNALGQVLANAREARVRRIQSWSNLGILRPLVTTGAGAAASEGIKVGVGRLFHRPPP